VMWGLGGNGCTGGNDGESGGGGGGSGYSDGSVTVIDTQQGGSDGAAKVIIRIADSIITVNNIVAVGATFSGTVISGVPINPPAVPSDTEDDTEYITCGTFAPTITTSYGGTVEGNAHLFLSSSTCTDTYLGPIGTEYSHDTNRNMWFNSSVPLRVSTGGVISVLAAQDAMKWGAPTFYLDLVLILDDGAERIIEIGKPHLGGMHGGGWNLNTNGPWRACTYGQWISVTLTQGGTITGLKTRGSNPGSQIGNTIGLGQMKINGTLIYPGQTYSTG